jgi:phage tail protein X
LGFDNKFCFFANPAFQIGFREEINNIGRQMSSLSADATKNVKNEENIIMWGLEKIADWVDEHTVKREEASHKLFQETYKGKGNVVYEYIALQELQLYYLNKYLSTTPANSLNTILELFDSLRLGEGIKNGGWGYVEDSLRVISILPSFGKVGGKALKLSRAFFVKGGPMSCAFTSTMQTLNLSGRMLYAPLSALGKEVVAFKTPVSKLTVHPRTYLPWFDNEVKIGSGTIENLTDAKIRDKDFGGTFIKIYDDMIRPLNIADSDILRPKFNNLKEVEKFVDTTGLPTLVGYKYPTGGGHYIAVHKTPFGVKIADQFGKMRTLKDLGDEHLKMIKDSLQDSKNKGIILDERAWKDWIDKTSKDPADFVNKIYQIDESVAIKHSVWLRSEIVATMQQANNSNNKIFMHIAVPVFEFKLEEMRELLKNYPRPNKWEPISVPVQPNSPPPIIKDRTGLNQKQEITRINSDMPPQVKMVNVYKARAGDTLFGLAKKFYGNAAVYKTIQDANVELFSLQPNFQIPIGNELVIPGR